MMWLSVIMDNYAPHKTAAIKTWLARRPHYHVHFTPTSASWINRVERWFAELTGKQIRRAVHSSTKKLEADIRAFLRGTTRTPSPTNGPNPPTISIRQALLPEGRSVF